MTFFDEARYQLALSGWRLLAERRLNELRQHYESGRWQRYFDEQEILELLSEAALAVDVWRKISPRDNDAAMAVPERAASALPPPAPSWMSMRPPVAA